MKRKVFTAFALLLCCTLLCSCSLKKYWDTSISIDGFENFDLYEPSQVGLNVSLLPSEDFTERFKHEEIVYRYRNDDTFFNFSSKERTLVAVSYSPEVYEDAKQYCFQEMELSKTNVLEYKGYVFVENVTSFFSSSSSCFPIQFNMFAYNDNLNSLLFIGLFGDDYKYESASDVAENWGTFIEEHFGDMYDWGETATTTTTQNTGDGSIVS